MELSEPGRSPRPIGPPRSCLPCTSSAPGRHRQRQSAVRISFFTSTSSADCSRVSARERHAHRRLTQDVRTAEGSAELEPPQEAARLRPAPQSAARVASAGPATVCFWYPRKLRGPDRSAATATPMLTNPLRQRTTSLGRGQFIKMIVGKAAPRVVGRELRRKDDEHRRHVGRAFSLAWPAWRPGPSIRSPGSPP